MPANKYALLRYRIIDRCISNKYNPFPNKEDLRQACEEELYGSDGSRISMSTIDKDLYAMRNESNLGYYAPIAYSKFEKGYYYKDPDYTIDDLPLNQEDVEAIEFAATTLAQFRGIPLFESSGDAIDKILGRLSLRPDHNQEVGRYVQFETPVEYKGSRYLKQLLTAIKSRRELQFTYQKFSGEQEKMYRVHPYFLKEYRNRWYLVAYNIEKGVMVVFGLDRMMGEIQVTEKEFSINSDFDVERYFANSLGITVVGDLPKNVRLRFSSLSGKYVESQPWHDSQKTIKKTAKYTEVELKLNLTKELIMQILSYGKDIVVIGPERLKKMVKSELEEALGSY